MRPISIFYHVYCTGNWKDMFEQQMERLRNSGLAKIARNIYIQFVFDEQVPEISFTEKFRAYVVNTTFLLPLKNDITEGEIPTMKMLSFFCKHSVGQNILYMHTKGVTYESTNPLYENVKLWREFLEYFMIDNWEDCNMLLNDYDIVCSTWLKQTHAFNGHATGNFFWARSEYLATLSRVEEVKLFDVFVKNPRIKAEFWIGTGNPNKIYQYVELPENIWGDFFYKYPMMELTYKNKVYPLKVRSKL